MDELITWLRAQVDDDAKPRTRASWHKAYCMDPLDMDSDERRCHYCGATEDPAKVESIPLSPDRQAEIDAKRAIIDAVERHILGHPGAHTNEDWPQDDACELCVEWNKTALAPYALRLLGLAYVHRPGYRAEWRP